MATILWYTYSGVHCDGFVVCSAELSGNDPKNCDAPNELRIGIPSKQQRHMTENSIEFIVWQQRIIFSIVTSKYRMIHATGYDLIAH